jgi:hypothetical protein
MRYAADEVDVDEHEPLPRLRREMWDGGERGGWRVEGGGWRVEGGRWRMEGGGWRVEAGGSSERRPTLANSSMISRELPPSIATTERDKS